MKPIRPALHAARVVGLLTLAWVYFAYTDLRWLLHLHAVHSLLTRAPLSFNYQAYLNLNLVNVAVAVIAACMLIFFPSVLLRSMMPPAPNSRALSAAWLGIGTGIGLGVIVGALYEFLAAALWTVYQSGKDAGWQTDLLTYTLIAVAGVIICRQVLARRGVA